MRPSLFLALFLASQLHFAAASAGVGNAWFAGEVADRIGTFVEQKGQLLARAQTFSLLQGVANGSVPFAQYGKASGSQSPLNLAAEMLTSLRRQVEGIFAKTDGKCNAIATAARALSDRLDAGEEFNQNSDFPDSSDPDLFNLDDTQMNARGFTIDDRFRNWVNPAFSNVKMGPSAVQSLNQDPRVRLHARALVELDPVFKQNFVLEAGDREDLKWQYFATAETGIAQFFPGRRWSRKNATHYSDYEPRFRPWFAECAAGPKDVVILVDASGSMRQNGRIDAAKVALKTVVNTLTELDFMNVLTFSADSSSLLGCAATGLVPASAAAKKEFIRAVDNVVPGGKTDFEAGFALAMEMINNSRAAGRTSGCQRLILFLTDGISSDPSIVIDKYNNLPTDLGVRIFSYTLGDQVDSEIPTKIACGNRGAVSGIREGGDVEGSMMQYYNFMGVGSPRWSYPYLASSGLGLMITRTYPVFKKGGGLFGVAAIDVTIGEVRDSILNYFSSGAFPEGTYAFVVTADGTAVVHPLATSLTGPPAKDIAELEMVGGAPAEFVTKVRPRLLTRQSGTATILMPQRIPLGRPEAGIEVAMVSTTYFFQPVIGTDFVLGVRVPAAAETFEIMQETVPPTQGLLYHRLSAYRNSNTDTTALALKDRYAALGNPTVTATWHNIADLAVVLSHTAYQVPTRAFRKPDQWTNSPVESFAESLTVIDFIANTQGKFSQNNDTSSPLKESVRPEVQVLCPALATLYIANGYDAGSASSKNDVIWLYFASRNGLFISWPGSEISNKFFDAHSRPWYRKALARALSGQGTFGSFGPLTVSAPYVDAGGSGFVMTVSGVIFDPVSPTEPAGVSGADFRADDMFRGFDTLFQTAFDTLQTAPIGTTGWNYPGADNTDPVPNHACGGTYDCIESPSGRCKVECYVLDLSGFVVHKHGADGTLFGEDPVPFGSLEPSMMATLIREGVVSVRTYDNFDAGCVESVPVSPSSTAIASPTDSPGMRAMPFWTAAAVSTFRVAKESEGRRVSAEQQTAQVRVDCQQMVQSYQFNERIFGSEAGSELASLRSVGRGELLTLFPARGSNGTKHVASAGFRTQCEQGRGYVAAAPGTNTFVLILDEYYRVPSRTQIVEGEIVPCPSVEPKATRLSETCGSRPVRQNAPPVCVPYPLEGIPCDGTCEEDCNQAGDCINGKCLCVPELRATPTCSDASQVVTWSSATVALTLLVGALY